MPAGSPSRPDGRAGEPEPLRPHARSRCESSGVARMSRGRILLLPLPLAPLLALPTSAGARSLPLVGMVTAPLEMVVPGVVGRRAAYRTRHHRKTAHVRRHKQVAARSSWHRGAETIGV